MPRTLIRIGGNRLAVVLLLVAGVLSTGLMAQEETQEEIKQLRSRVQQLENLVKRLEAQAGDGAAAWEFLTGNPDDPEAPSRLARAVEKEIEKTVALTATSEGTPSKPIWLFRKLEGGLLFTGYLRSRFEYRANNLDFRTGNEAGGAGVDDEGVRMSGRFRLGFGAQIFKSEGTATTPWDTRAPGILAITEFQAVGDFANNTYVVQPARPVAGATSIGVDPLISPQPYGTVGFYQGYMLFEDFFINDVNLDVAMGRQEIALGSEMIFGTNDFYEGLTHDALRVSWANSRKPSDIRWQVDAFFAIEANTDTAAFDLLQLADFDQDHLYGLYVRWGNEDFHNANERNRGLSVDAYLLYFNGREADPSSFGLELATGSSASFFDNTVRPLLVGQFFTFGTRAFYMTPVRESDSLRLNLEVAFQVGEGQLSDITGAGGGVNPLGLGGAEKDIFGVAVEFIANYQYNVGDHDPMITLAYYFASGSDDLANDLGFQPMFINRHFSRLSETHKGPQFPGGGRYGNLDIMPLHNIHIVKLTLSNEFAFSDDTSTKDWEIGLSYLLGIVDEDQGYGDDLFGHEIDLFAVYTPNSIKRYTDHLLQISANLSIFLPEDGATNLSQALFFPAAGIGRAGDDPAIAFYIQALVAF